jgi:hypothetical protein
MWTSEGLTIWPSTAGSLIMGGSGTASGAREVSALEAVSGAEKAMVLIAIRRNKDEDKEINRKTKRFQMTDCPGAGREGNFFTVTLSYLIEK